MRLHCITTDRYYGCRLSRCRLRWVVFAAICQGLYLCAYSFFSHSYSLTGRRSNLLSVDPRESGRRGLSNFGGWLRDVMNNGRSPEDGVCGGHSLSPSDFQVIGTGRGRSYVYSAYLDDRKTARDIYNDSLLPVVRVFGYIPHRLEPTKTWKCLLWYSERQSEPNVVAVHTVTYLDIDAELRYRVVMIVCRPPSDLTGSISPCAVSLVPIPSTTTQLRNSKPSKYQPVTNSNIPVYNSSSATSATTTTSTSSILGSLRWDNVVPVNDLRKTREQYGGKPEVNFTVCVPPLHHPHYTWMDIVKFVEINRILGAQKFIFFVSLSTRKDLRDVLKQYSDDSKTSRPDNDNDDQLTRYGLVEVYQWNPPDDRKIFLRNYGNKIAISECLYRTMYRTRYLAIQDLDELIVPTRARSWNEMIAAIKPAKVSTENIAAFNFRNLFFALNVTNDAKFVNDSVATRYDIWPLVKTSRDRIVYPNRIRSKVIVRPELLLMVHVHFAEPHDILNRSFSRNHQVHVQDGVLFHYRDHVKIKMNKLLLNTRMHQYADDIIKRVPRAMDHYRQILPPSLPPSLPSSLLPSPTTLPLSAPFTLSTFRSVATKDVANNDTKVA